MGNTEGGGSIEPGAGSPGGSQGGETEVLTEWQRFESLLVDLSAAFVNVPAQKVDGEIERWLQRIVQFFEVDRSTLAQFAEEGKLHITHSWAREGFEPVIRIIANTALPWATERLRQAEIVALSRLDEVPADARLDREYFERVGVKAGVIIPLAVAGVVVGAMTLGSLRHEREWHPILFRRLRLVGEILANVLERKRAEEERNRSYRDIQQLKDRLQAERDYLEETIAVQYSHDEIIGRSSVMRRVLRQVEQVAPTDSTVLIQGETGTGKELIARAIHKLSRRKDRVMVTVNCASLPSTLIESELFGREKGAYTGALTKEIGRFELANGSTVFLDEIGELPPELQGKLLRVLEKGEFERLGSSKTNRIDVRLIAATNRDLSEQMRQHNFREDLYYRLNVFPIHVPPLRERREDIRPLVWAFTREFAERMGKTIETIPRREIEALQRYAWPGNVRELRNVVERAAIRCNGPVLHIEAPDPSDGSDIPDMTLDDVQRRHILRVLEMTSWRVSGKSGAAEILGMKPTTLVSRMEKLGIRRPHDV